MKWTILLFLYSVILLCLFVFLFKVRNHCQSIQNVSKTPLSIKIGVRNKFELLITNCSKSVETSREA